MFTRLRQKQHKHLDNNKIFSGQFHTIQLTIEHCLLSFYYLFYEWSISERALFSVFCHVFLLFRLIKRTRRDSPLHLSYHLSFHAFIYSFANFERWDSSCLHLFTLPSETRVLSTASSLHKRFNEHTIRNGICLKFTEIIPSKLIK